MCDRTGVDFVSGGYVELMARIVAQLRIHDVLGGVLWCRLAHTLSHSHAQSLAAKDSLDSTIIIVMVNANYLALF